MVTVKYQNKGTCSVLTTLTLNDDHTIESVEVERGCNGNLKGVCALLKGMKAEDAIAKIKGINCRDKGTSCPDQISHAIEAALAQL